MKEPPFSPKEWEACLKVLQALARDPDLALDAGAIGGLVAKINKKVRKNNRKQNQVAAKLTDHSATEQTVIHQLNPVSETSPPVFNPAPAIQKLKRPKSCYICKTPYRDLHFFYSLLCPACAAVNFAKRDQSADLRGRTALVTGGRIKIGYQTALRMLRDGATVWVTTRFPHDAALRFSREPDFDTWKTRLQIAALDLRLLPAVGQFVQYLHDRVTHLDILINNAAQTVKRPAGFYQHLSEIENTPRNQLPKTAQQILPAQWPSSSLPSKSGEPHSPASRDELSYFPAGLLDRHGQQIDLRPQHSWTLRLHEVDMLEMLEVQLVNAAAPFLLNSRLKPLLLKSPFPRRFIINVSAMEGQFNRENKTANHPHTNMAKAALNMMTRTSAQDYARDGIFMNSVDTGWITQENPHPKKTGIRARGFAPPLDEIDGMARIYDPIVQGLSGEHTPVSGCFLKDYQPHPW